MGIRGLTTWIENSGCTRLARSPTDAMHHLCIDMNCILHIAYDRQKPTAECTIQSVITLLNKLLHYFPPQKTLALVFDGSAPISKLRTQRERRKTYPSNPNAALDEADIMVGSAFVWDCEQKVEAWAVDHIQRTALPGKEVFFSGSRAPGEGETKIMSHLIRLAHATNFNPDDRIVIVGNDSDLFLHAIACTSYHNLFVVNPFSFIMACIGDLFWDWCGRGDSLSPFTWQQLPTVRTDFVLLWLLCGGDHYPGLENEFPSFWRQYRKLRGNGGEAPFVDHCRKQLGCGLRLLVFSCVKETCGREERSRRCVAPLPTKYTKSEVEG